MAKRSDDVCAACIGCENDEAFQQQNSSVIIHGCPLDWLCKPGTETKHYRPAREQDKKVEAENDKKE